DQPHRLDHRRLGVKDHRRGLNRGHPHRLELGQLLHLLSITMTPVATATPRAAIPTAPITNASCARAYATTSLGRATATTAASTSAHSAASAGGRRASRTVRREPNDALGP